VFYKNHEKFATSFWIPTLFGVTAGFIFILLITIYMSATFGYKNEYVEYIIIVSPLVIDLCHVISDICFIFYTKSIPESNFTDIFIYLHAVTGVLGMFVLLFYIGLFIKYMVSGGFRSREKKAIFYRIERIIRQFTITITFIWTPIVQMLNMSLFSGNDYYWTKSILALNMIYFSRVINYVGKEVKNKSKVENEDNKFGLLSIVFHVIHRFNDD